MSHDHFDTLVATHHDEVYKYLVLVTGRVSDADDLSQQTFLRAFEARRSPGLLASGRPWLFAVATDLGRKRLRSKSRRRRARRPIGEGDREARARRPKHPVALAIARLPVKQRMAFALRKLHGLDYEEIGRLLRCSSRSARACAMQAFRRVGQMRSVRSALGSVITTKPTIKE